MPASPLSPRNVLLGFIAGALAVVTVHQAVIFIFGMMGLARGAAWSLEMAGPYGLWLGTPAEFSWRVPRLVNLMFWGGLWGSVYALVERKLPGKAPWLRGLFLAVLMVVFANWILIPLLKNTVFGSKQDYFGGFAVQRMLVSLAINASFGVALGILYSWMGRRQTMATS
jgi:hypothetical protein